MPINDFIPDHAAAVTPSDTNGQFGYALYVGGAGNVNMLTEGGETVLFSGLTVGQILNVRFQKILATLTTATLLVRMMRQIYAIINSVAPAVTGLTTVGSLLTCSTGTWLGNPAPTFTYQWQRNGVNIAGQTGNTHTIAAPTVIGNTLRCVVTATQPTSPPTVVSVNSNAITVT